MNTIKNAFYTKKLIPEGITADYPVSVCFSDFSHTADTAHWHWHDEIEVLIVTSGQLNVHTETSSVSLRSGQGIIINENIVHSYQSSGLGPCTCYTLAFSPQFFIQISQVSLNANYLQPVLASFTLIPLSNANSWDGEVLGIVNDIILTNMRKNPGYELATKGYLCHLWLRLYEKEYQKKPYDKPSVSTETNLDRVKIAMKYIEEHYADSITLDDIADSIHLSKSECCRCFKRTLQMTPFEYLMKHRIHEACQIIASSPEKVSVSNLALSVGFNNASYFNKIFKQTMNCTPSAFMASLRKK